MASHEDVATQQFAQQLQDETRGLQSLPQQSHQNGTEDYIPCLWVNCGERMPGAEALYDHVCERHIGRKSTNNLNLTCQWANCRTTTVKRDHITSHMRVHVPLKPHKCEFCGKAFKRPQDLKKHVKTHADDSVLLRSPDGRNQQNGHAYFGGHDLNGGGYAPTVNHNGAGGNGFYPTPQSYAGYGQVNYPGTSLADQQSMETRRRAIEALNDFLGDVKRRSLDPGHYYDVGQRLNTQALPLPVSIGTGYSMGNGYQSVNTGNPPSTYAGLLESLSNGHGGMQGGVSTHAATAQNYALPMSNARTKADLLDIDRFLEQLQATVYENPGQAAAAGVPQPGIHPHIGSTFNAQRSSHSPPQYSTGSNAHANMNGLSQVAQMATMTNNGHTGVDTPALTPTSMSSSYNSGHSPASSHSRASHDSSSLYPHLPSVTGMSDMGPGYTSAPPPGLASGFDSYDSSRRYSGSRLQREAPPSANEDSMDIDSDGQRTPRKMSLLKEAIRGSSPNNNVDPALRSADAAEEDKTGSSTPDEENKDKDQSWVENVRVIDQLREWVRNRLENGEFERDEDSTPEPLDKIKEHLQQEQEQHAAQQEQEEEPIAYPTLKTEEE